jgi:hypothetical protein
MRINYENESTGGLGYSYYNYFKFFQYNIEKSYIMYRKVASWINTGELGD